MIVACCFLLFFGGKTLSYGQDKKINLREEGSPSSSQSRKNRSVAGRKLKVYRRASGSVRFLPLPSEWPGSSSENVSGGAVPVAGKIGRASCREGVWMAGRGVGRGK